MQINDPIYRKETYQFLIGRLPNKVRNNFVAAVGEFVGTFLFLFFAFSATQVANTAKSGNAEANENKTIADIPDTPTLLYIALGFGFSLAVNAWVFFRISGGLFNPAVTLGLVLIGGMKVHRAILIFIAQILGATAASALVKCLFPGELQVATALGGGTSVAQGVWIEAFLTAELVFTIIMLAAEKHKGTFLAPIGIGLSLFICEMTGVYFTGGSLNPARSLGPAIVLHSFQSYHWIYWVGPGIGSFLAAGFYHLINLFEYETANPGQDFNEKEMERFVFDEEAADTGAHIVRPDATDVLAPIVESEEASRGRSPSSQIGSPSPNGILGRLASRTDSNLRTASGQTQEKSVASYDDAVAPNDSKV